MKNNIFLFNKGTNNSAFSANFAPKNYVKIFKKAQEAVVTGARRCSKITLQDSIFEDRTAHAKVFNLCVNAQFKKLVDEDQEWAHRVNYFFTNRMHYFLIDRKFFICFKAIGKKGKIEGMDTVRFSDTLQGDDFAVKESVRAELSRLGIVGTPPIIFVGFYRNGNSVLDVIFQNYYGGNTVLNFRLQDLISEQQIVKKNAKKDSSNEDDALAV